MLRRIIFNIYNCTSGASQNYLFFQNCDISLLTLWISMSPVETFSAKRTGSNCSINSGYRSLKCQTKSSLSYKPHDSTFDLPSLPFWVLYEVLLFLSYIITIRTVTFIMIIINYTHIIYLRCLIMILKSILVVFA